MTVKSMQNDASSRVTEDAELAELDATLRELLGCLPSLTAAPRTASVAAFARAHLTGNERLTPAEQLEIYRQQYWLRHTSALLEDFPALARLLGQAEWEALVESYLTTHTPRSWTLRDLGEALPAHLAARPQTPHHGLCAELSQLEWAHVSVFDAADGSELDAARLLALPPSDWERARIVTLPALRLIWVRYPVAKLRRELIAASKSQLAPSDWSNVLPEPRQTGLVVYRDRDRVVREHPLSLLQASLLAGLQARLPLLEACQLAVERAPTEQARLEAEVGAWFAEWARRGWFVDVEV
jgi:hypothetical protein